MTAEEAASSLAAIIHPSLTSTASPLPLPPARGVAYGKLGKSRLGSVASGGHLGGTSPAAAVTPAEKDSLPNSGGATNDEGRTDKSPAAAALAAAAMHQEAGGSQDVRQRRQQLTPQQAAAEEQEPLIAQGGGTLQVSPLPHCHCQLVLGLRLCVLTVVPS